MNNKLKVLNIAKFLPIDGLLPENDITLKIYNDLQKRYQVKSEFVMPCPHIPKWTTNLKKSLKINYGILNNTDYYDKNYNLKINFFKSVFPISFLYKYPTISYYDLIFQFNFYGRNLIKIFKRYSPNLIHAHTVTDAFYAYKLFKKFHIPYVVTLRGSYIPLYDNNLIKKILKNAKCLITPSYNLYSKLSNNYNIKLMPHGLNNVWYLKGNKKTDNSIQRLVTVSRLLKMKNIQIVIETIAKMKKDGFSVRYDIVGDGPYKIELEKLVKQLDLKNEIKFYGFQSEEEIIKIYKNNDIFIMLSYPETFGRVYFEAAAQGLLVFGVKETGADGYFKSDEAIFIEPNIKNTFKTLKNLKKYGFKNKIIKSRLKVNSFKNEIIIKQYYSLICNSFTNNY